MGKVFLIAEQNKNTQEMAEYLEKQGNVCHFAMSGSEGLESQVKKCAPDVVIIDTALENSDIITKQIKTQTEAENVQVILLLNANKDFDFLNFADGYMTEPVSSSILKNTINSHLKIKKALDKLSETNRDLPRRLYQINSLYNISSRFASTLDKGKLCDIMLEGLEKTLSFDIAAVLIFNTDNKANLFLNSLHQPSDSLKEALKLRLTLAYKNLFSKKDLPYDLEFGDLESVEKFKPSHTIYDLKALNFDSMNAPIKVGNDFFGIIEIFRQNPFSQEDVTCFQTIVHQVALPLRNATLYDEIKQTNKKLEKLERLKSEFVSTVSHELRTPLTPINNSLNIVLSGQTGELSEDAKNFINMAKRNVTRLSGIIEDLLDLSRIETGKLEFKFKSVQLKPSLELTEKTFSQLAKDKEICLKLAMPKSLPGVYADTNRVEQVLSNLVNNALKFTPKGGEVSITVDTINAKDINKKKLILPKGKLKGEYIRICTKDTGIGIDEEDIVKIFDKFSQLESTLARSQGGIGLGLSIAKQLIDAHLGAILVESQKDKGSNFCFLLPVETEKRALQVDIQDALEKKDFGAIYICQNTGCDFIKRLKERNTIKLTKDSKELLVEESGIEHYFALTPNLDPSVLDFVEKAAQAELEKESLECGILFKKASTAKECECIIKILEELI